MTSANISVRIATIHDLDFIVSLIPRLLEFGAPLWRDKGGMIATDTQVLMEKLSNNPPDTLILIAEDDQMVPLGFIHLHPGNDYYNKEPHAHISDVIILDRAAGQGIGQLLIAQAENWARQKGYHWITLSVFAQNIRARELYSRLGYGEDIMKFVKEL